ncbi:helix-turn-helix domain-containing protein [Aminobacterium mobile]|jgi:transcriptional regulator with XRE-family HTH domain|uniref:helix-turn-helix domain-containing protein n=1 Tax=Aminobacterium mobile TaxID=81467 RepID=UPI0033146AF5
MKQLKILREKEGLTQAQLAEKAKLSPNTIWNFENGRREPRMSDLQKFASIFNCTIDELINPTQPRREETQAGETETI